MRDALNEEFGGEVLTYHEYQNVDSLVKSAKVADKIKQLRRMPLTDGLELVLRQLDLVQDAIVDEALLVHLLVICDI